MFKLIRFEDREGWKEALLFKGYNIAQSEAETKHMRKSKKEAEKDRESERERERGRTENGPTLRLEETEKGHPETGAIGGPTTTGPNAAANSTRSTASYVGYWVTCLDH